MWVEPSLSVQNSSRHDDFANCQESICSTSGCQGPCLDFKVCVHNDIKFLKQYGLKICDWSTVAGINQVLRAVFKYLKEECDDQLVRVYYNSVTSCLSKVPLDLLDQYQVCYIGGTERSSSTIPLHLNNFGAMEPEIKFLGTFLQLLCSLIDRNDLLESGDGSVHEHLLVTVGNLVPKLVKWSLDRQGDSTDMSIIQYFKHKLLVLMIRLSSYKCLDCSVLLSWLELLRNYFQELLWKPLTQTQSDQDDCLEGSPFSLSLSDGEVNSMHSSHLQRKKGSLELYKWLQIHLPSEISIDQEKYLETCLNFMSSFLHLYLGEDDLLFEVLLQLLGTTSCLQQQFDKKEAAFQDVKKVFPFRLLDVFNPVQLFHLFLSEIHYDHQVLLDYLISKDTGISCAKYLLRCLCLVCNSWQLFVEFPLFGEPINQSPSKKRKVFRDNSEFLVDGTPSLMDNKGIIPSLAKNYEEDSECEFKHYYMRPFKKAKECLLSLKDSVENLHQKNLFPYNPKVLLKRLKIFEEFSCKEEAFHKPTS